MWCALLLDIVLKVFLRCSLLLDTLFPSACVVVCCKILSSRQPLVCYVVRYCTYVCVWCALILDIALVSGYGVLCCLILYPRLPLMCSTVTYCTYVCMWCSMLLDTILPSACSVGCGQMLLLTSSCGVVCHWLILLRVSPWSIPGFFLPLKGLNIIQYKVTEGIFTKVPVCIFLY